MRMLAMMAMTAGLALGPAATARAQGKAFSEHNCGDRLVVCLQVSGAPVPGEQVGAFRVGEHVHVIVLAVAEDGVSVSIETASTTSANSVLPPKSNALETVIASSSTVDKLAERVLDVPNAELLTVFINRKKGDEVSIGSTTLSIEEPLYFARAGLAFTWVDRGSRKITAEHAIIEETESFPGVALTIWPWGHRANKLAALERPAWRTFGDLIGVQIGTDLDFTKPFDRAFFGLVLEPISGIGISGGVAVTTGSYFSGAPVASTMAVVDRHMWRPYFALTLTTELFDTLKALADRKEQPSP